LTRKGRENFPNNTKQRCQQRVSLSFGRDNHHRVSGFSLSFRNLDRLIPMEFPEIEGIALCTTPLNPVV